MTEEQKKVALMQMEGLLNTLNDAKEYGSLLNVESYDWELLEKFVENTCHSQRRSTLTARLQSRLLCLQASLTGEELPP